MKDYEIVLGLEVHLQLNTPTKMFCGCENKPFGSEPNSHVCPVCLGLPGAMPVSNKDAIISAQKTAHALGAKLNKSIVFERKNYFYPDLPKSFQLTCPHNPIGEGGELNMEYWNGGVIRFREIHLEEDTAKSMHKDEKTWIDFNKSGVPLLEIVTEPDIHDIDLAVNFCKEIQRIARYIGVSEASMQKGNMRLEANISVRKKGDSKLPNYRVELKNINSFSFMKKALGYELRRQTGALEIGKELFQETRGFDESKGETFVQRSKEEANDYRYFPEPDIPPIEFDDEWFSEITTSKFKLPRDVRNELLKQDLNRQYVDVFVNDSDLFAIYSDLLKLSHPSNKAADLVVNESKYKGLTARQIDEKEKESLSEKITLEDELSPIIDDVLKVNTDAVSDYKSGNESSLQFLIGQVMKNSQGKADAQATKDILLKKLT